MKAVELQGQDNVHFTERFRGRRGALLSQTSQHSAGTDFGGKPVVNS